MPGRPLIDLSNTCAAGFLVHSSQQESWASVRIAVWVLECFEAKIWAPLWLCFCEIGCAFYSVSKGGACDAAMCCTGLVQSAWLWSWDRICPRDCKSSYTAPIYAVSYMMWTDSMTASATSSGLVKDCLSPIITRKATCACSCWALERYALHLLLQGCIILMVNFTMQVK